MGLKVWIALVMLRFLVCLYPAQMTGYIHPDQFFQTAEPLAGDIFGFDHFRTWDWNATAPGPIRNVFFPYASVGVSFLALKTLVASGLANISGYTLQAFPRVAITATSLLADFAVYVTAKSIDLNPWNCVTVLASSYVTLAFSTRTFTNGFECCLFGLVVMLVIISNKDRFKVATRHVNKSEKGEVRLGPKKNKKKRKETSKKKEHRLSTRHEPPKSDAITGSCLGIIIVIGTFCRPTFPAFFLIPLAFWLTGTVTDLNGKAVVLIAKRVASILPGAIVALMCCLVMDSIYYGTLDAAVLSNPKLLVNFGTDVLRNITVTPLNFIMYNINNVNLEKHGIHPRIAHFAVNLPQLFLPMFICLLMDVYLLYKTKGQCLRNGFTVVTSYKFFMLSFLCPMILLSLIPHHETRYILPVLIPLVLLYSDRIMRKQSSLPCVSWIVFNLLGCFMFGALHQGGVLPCMEYLHSVATTPVDNAPTSFHFVFYHTYMPPRHLLHLQDKIIPPHANLTEEYQDVLKMQDHVVTVHDLMGTDTLSMFTAVNNILSDSYTPIPAPYNKEIYLISPASLDTIFCRINVKYNFKMVAEFSPHLSMEDPPEWFPSYDCVAQPERSYSHMNLRRKLQSMFSLLVYKVEMV